MKHLYKIALLLLMLCAPSYAAVQEVQPSVIVDPAKPGPGDIMIVTLKGLAGNATGTFLGKKLYFNPAKESLKAIVPVDFFTDAGKYDLEISSNGVSLIQPIEIVKKKYEVQRLELPHDMVQLSAQNEARAERDQNEWLKYGPKKSARLVGDFINPLEGEIISPFGLRRVINNTPKVRIPALT